MSEPLVAAIMLTKDRPAMAARAVRAFREQTYQNKFLKVLDTGDEKLGYIGDEIEAYSHEWTDLSLQAWSIGRLRNEAIVRGPEHADIIIHWDSDDVSHPNRISEQVAHLQLSGADVVGYNELLFWRSPACDDGEAWILRNSKAKWGTSFCYWRKTWERKPFPDLPKTRGGVGEDSQWATGLNIAASPAFGYPDAEHETLIPKRQNEPRLIASIHGGNTSTYRIEEQARRGADWKRVPEWDSYCRSKMQI